MYLMTFAIITFFCLTPQFADESCNVFKETQDHIWVESKDQAQATANEIAKGVSDGFGKNHFVKVGKFVLHDTSMGPTFDRFE